VGRPSRYPDEFRHEAVQMALATQDSRASVARRLGINETTLRNWVANHLAEEARQADRWR
jgi:transposase